MDKIMKSDTLKIYLLLLANCHFRQGKSEIHITYVTKKQQWIDAAKHCKQNLGGILESNETVIENQLNSNNINDDVWVGQYQTWTPWYAVFGCYEVKFGTTFKVERQGFFECQKLCADAEYFSTKNDQCVCIDDISSLTRVKDYKPCNCCNCFKIMKNNIDVFGDGDNPSTQNMKCMAAQCAGPDYQITRENCETSYAVQCDNGLRSESLSHRKAFEMCADNGSFIQWIPESACLHNANEVYLKQHWTSATKSRTDFKHVLEDKVDVINPIKCRRRKPRSKELEYVDCQHEYSFFCRDDTDAVENHGQSTSFPSCKSNNDNMASSGVNSGAVAGSVVAVLIIIIVVLAGLFLYERRKDNKIPNMRNLQGNNKLSTQIQQTTSIRQKSVHEYHEINLNQSQDESQSAYSQISDDQFINEPSKSRYSFARPIINEKCTPANVNTIGQYTNGDSDTSEIRQQRIIKVYPSSANTTEHHYDKTNENQQCHDQAKADIFGRQNLNFEINEKEGEHLQYLKSSAVNPVQNANYSLEKPVRESGEIDPYSDNQDYDKLNSVQKKDGTNTQCKVYDHLPTTEEADPTYDHSVINSPKVHDNNYDHFTFDDDNI